MAQCGVASRRHSEELIRAGKVMVNGKVVTQMGFLVSDQDKIVVDGTLIKKEEKKVYIMLNKPTGYVTTVSDPKGRRTVLDLIEGVEERIYPVGRLDYDTTGLLILTNDGDFAYESTHPGKEVTKTYLAEVKGRPSNYKLDMLRAGIKIDGFLTAPADVEIIKNKESSTILEIVIHEGRNRQVKRMCETIGHEVIKLKRTAVGSLTLGRLRIGHWRYLTPLEVNLALGREK
ncbi:MAG: rRNA pseudouridine synthase [Clostridiaceae bacterium]|nr:rRNA pseudouridine synthase [Clostridiaceae bacterium]